MTGDESHYRLMRLIEARPGLSQRDIAHELGMSLGKVNYCLRAVVSKGWIKAVNFKNSHNKAAYIYLLTPRGIEMKARLTARFLSIKMREYENLRQEIEQIRREAEGRTAD
ncbi:MAG: MarR family EPS-associated transcriptional regulator [Steroidobacteraceae bacterium]